MRWRPLDVTSTFVIRTLAILAPALLTWGLLLYRPPTQRLGAAAFLASAWVLSSSLVVNLIAIRTGWWSFNAAGGVFAGVPVDLWLGWALLWGAVPILALGSVPLWLVVGVAVWLDLVLMPAAAPVVWLGSHWLLGEALLIGLCLLPAQLLGRWTRDGHHLAARCAMQAILFSSLALWLLPLIILSQTGGDLGPLLARPAWQVSLAAQLLAVPAALGATAVIELYQHGRGTPFPWDPPSSLVTTGPYAYVANPMQLSMTLILAGLGIVLESLPVALAGLVAGAFSTGFAQWQEHGDLDRRFDQRWRLYRGGVRAWVPRWRPGLRATATLYYAESCLECSTVGGWFMKAEPISLHLVPAEEYPGLAPTRITYAAADGTIFTGVAALCSALDHVNLAWAWLGWTCRLPGVCHLAQLLVDAVGGGPRTIRSTPSKRLAP